MTYAENDKALVVAFPSSVIVHYNGKRIILPHDVAELIYECVLSERMTACEKFAQDSIDRYL